MEEYPYQPIINISGICAAHGMKEAVLSPGSRCAPLTLAFTRHPTINTYTITDERSAGFIGLGLAQQTGKLVGLVCTSGTAASNYGPAIAEAFYQHVPLIAFTADRPPEWLDQLDGQTIRQQNLHANHVKGFFQLPVDYSHPDAKWHIQRTISEAINLATTFPQGPVQVNVPFREPFYPTASQQFEIENPENIILEEDSEQVLSELVWEKLKTEAQGYRKILLVAGQGKRDEKLLDALRKSGLPVVSDVISNASELENAIRHQDAFLARADLHEELKPDLIVSFGKSVISKNLKLFLRKNKPAAHWHTQPAGQVADTFQSLTKILRCEPAYFFTEAREKELFQPETSFTERWKNVDEQTRNFTNEFLGSKPDNEFSFVKELMQNLPQNVSFHLANSMSVRYANFVNQLPEGAEVWANRGTSGIDGSNSSAVGHALASPEKLHVLLTGDLAFFYDRNAFWNKYLPPNLKIILLNNKGGGIFRMIPGPVAQPELEEYFVTSSHLDASYLCQEFGMDYFQSNSVFEGKIHLKRFWEVGSVQSLLEFGSDGKQGQEIFQEFKGEVKNLQF
ncbi:2-succinyl-5-enolpyruvyl-6-hydroxy-3-cyclohexene-1-carboxylic-acid synthase [Flammeovirgaceae bacterium SG7u.111]|nr:2-succinyl-5-enolpyruvyl-6-hydroxy-3-cyclohexene-1-carboxylic-acid synthase [Flammeovirgaceae bacterium SG7u.132]WPO37466.1 2-succinyl-5-enolpyruvyl-6-hydroxy-3-cyclohexene-1-carboxylic-acid synthase [Flammeovirgaceae bacterium SG7u.111]